MSQTESVLLLTNFQIDELISVIQTSIQSIP